MSNETFILIQNKCLNIKCASCKFCKNQNESFFCEKLLAIYDPKSWACEHHEANDDDYYNGVVYRIKDNKKLGYLYRPQGLVTFGANPAPYPLNQLRNLCEEYATNNPDDMEKYYLRAELVK